MNRYPSRPLAIMTLLLLTACAPAATGGSATNSPATSTSADPTRSPAASASSITRPSSSDAAARGIPADSIVVATVNGLRIRETPGVDGAQLGTLSSGFESLVVDGPETVDGMDWYLISGLGLFPNTGCEPGPNLTNPYQCPFWFGWAAQAAEDGTVWLEETEPTCPDPHGSLDTFAFAPRLLYLACHDDEPITLRGYHMFTPGIADCPGVPEDLYWLGCVGGQHQLVSAQGAYTGLVVTLGPGASLPGDDVELVVTGHFNDPASAECTYDERPQVSVLNCRSQFVVHSAAPAAP